MARRPPPKKQPGQAKGRRRFNGTILDVDGLTAHLGGSEKQVRGQVARGLLPYRRLGGRIVFLVDEVDEFLRRLPGVTAEEALANLAARRIETQEEAGP